MSTLIAVSYPEESKAEEVRQKLVQITLQIDSTEDERVKNSTTSSTIEAFSQDELSLKSDRGGTSTFTRTTSL